MDFRRISKIIAITLISIIAILFLFFKLIERNFRLSLVPVALKVSEIIYAKQEAWGFGPGGAECGVIVYKLPDKIASKVSENGLEYFVKLPNSDKDLWGNFGTWRETPYLFEIEKGDGFSLYIDPRIEREICSTASKRGAFFARSNFGVIVVSPETKRVYFFYTKESNINVPFPIERKRGVTH